METKILIDGLSDQSVSVVKRKYIVENGKEYFISEPMRRSYLNNNIDRQMLKNDVPEPYYSSIMSVFGDHPLVSDGYDE